MNRTILIILALATIIPARSQDIPKKFEVKGYFETLETAWIPGSSAPWLTMGSLKNRIDIRWQPAKAVQLNLGIRNNFDYGQIVQRTYPFLAEYASNDEGFFDLTHLWASDTSFYLFSNIDRANVKLSLGSLELTAGRQRINWGLNLVWTPNDIFNSFNYFDFDYAERPGCDALLAEYYTGLTSSLQLAVKLDADDSITAALMYRFNRWGYDLQFFGGVMEEDVVAGLGWSGHIEGAGFSGEASYFRNMERIGEDGGVLVGSAGLNYTFKKGWFLMGSYLFNSSGTTGKAGSASSFLTQYRDISAKNFTLARHSVFGSVSYPITPLINASLASIVNPNDGSGFAGPSVDFSLTNNISLYVIAQAFWGDTGSEYGDYGTLAYMRLKWNF